MAAKKTTVVKNMICEPKESWGHDIWTNKKLDAFEKYVAAYLKIMKKNPYWKTIYFDGFAGSGDRGVDEVKENNLFAQLEIEQEEEDVYKGSAERVLSIEGKFDYYYFVDTNKMAINSLKKRLSEKYKLYDSKHIFRPDDMNNQIKKMADKMKTKGSNLAALILLDPFGMQIKWDSIAALEGTKTDVWILIPTGVIVNRLLDKKGNLKNIKKLTTFFGLKETEIKDYFYFKRIAKGLFEEKEIVEKVSEPIKRIAELYSERLATIWKYPAKKTLILKNRKNVPIFHLVFASNNGNATKIAGQIIEKAEKK